MSHPHICPWWLCYTFDNPLRRLVHNPDTMLAPYIQPGMSVLDAGCGMGYFTMAMARLAGENGRVLALDLQKEMLDRLIRRAARAGVGGRIEPRLCKPDSLGIERELDFALAFWMAHETPDQRAFFAEIRKWLRPGGMVLVTEPVFHVSARDFAETVDAALKCGLMHEGSPKVSLSRTALFKG